MWESGGGGQSLRYKTQPTPQNQQLDKQAMTLHITTITKNHIITVSDRTFSTTDGSNREIENDAYKHFLLETDDSSVTIGFAGLSGTTSDPLATFDLLTKITSECQDKKLTKLEDYLNAYFSGISKYIDNFKAAGMPEQNLGIAILIQGWIGTAEHGTTRYVCALHNCLDNNSNISTTVLPTFKQRTWLFKNEDLKNGSYTLFTGNNTFARAQHQLIRQINNCATRNLTRSIFDTSVNIIHKAHIESNGTIGLNCSGLRISIDEKGTLCPGIEAYDHRKNVEYDTVMLNIYRSLTGKIISIENSKGVNK